MAAGCNGFAVQTRPEGRGARRSLRPGMAVLAAALLNAVAFTGAGSPARAATASATFNEPLALAQGAGSTASALTLSQAGDVFVAGSTSPGAGCVLFDAAHSGSSAKYLGRTPGGNSCAAIATLGASGAGLALATQGGSGLLTGRSNSGASFAWARTAGLLATNALAADPVASGASAATFLIVRDARSGVPRIAASRDAGLTYTVGAAVINRAGEPAGAWRGRGPSPVTGNLVARRDATGLHLYTAFAAGSDRLNRIYAAIGTVAAAAPGATANVTWRDVEVYRGSPTAAFQRPSIAVDSAGQVYVAFADGRHLYMKKDFDGLQWKPAASPMVVDAAAGGLPRLDTAMVPAIAAGSRGKADLAWLAATGGAWNIYFAQTLDGGASWAGEPAGGALALHRGAFDPPDAVQLAVDQVSGAAYLVYTGDPTVAGLPALFATRQCTGISAVTGLALVNDCVAPQPATPVLPGTTCPGPQVTDAPGDAMDTSAVGAGAQLPSLDLLQAGFRPAGPDTQLLTLTVNRAAATLPDDVDSAWWVVTWTQNGARHYAQVTAGRGRALGYGTGLVNSDGSLGAAKPVTGTLNPGADGGFLLTLGRSAGAASGGAVLHDISAATYARFTSQADSVAQLVDRAPDGGSGADYTVGQICAPQANMPEVPAAVIIPVLGGVLGAFVWLQRRRRPRRREA